MNQTEAVQQLCLDDIPNCSAVDRLTLELVTDEDVNLTKLAGIIEENPVLVGLVIGLANSAYFGVPSTVVTVRDAIVKVLGIGLVRSLVLSVILGRTLDLTRCPAFSVGEYWAHSRATARFSQLLAMRSPIGAEWNRDQGYLGELLANFGQLLLVHHYPDGMQRVLATPPDSGNLIESQLAQVGLHQGPAGVLIDQHWQLPDIVVTVMQCAWFPEYRGLHWKLARLVGLISGMLGHYQQTGELPEASEELCELLAIDRHDTATQLSLLPDLYEDLERVAAHVAQSMS